MCQKKKAGQYERADRTFTSQNNWKIYIFYETLR